MAKLASRTAKKPSPTKRASPAKPKSKALAVSDPVKKASTPSVSLIDSQLALFRAAWRMTPMAMILRHQTAMFEGLAAGQTTAVTKRRKRVQSAVRHLI